MITIKNALVSSVAILESREPGHTLSMPKAAADGIDLAEFCERHGLLYWLNGKTLTLQKRAGTHSLPEPAPDHVPPPGTPLDQLHPGNRLRLMFGQPLLPQSPTDGDSIHCFSNPH